MLMTYTNRTSANLGEPSMRCLYINLDAAEARRRAIESSFAACAPPDWRLIRVPAKGPDDTASIPGAQPPAAKACWLSHRAALAATLEDTEDVFIVEDDTRFSRQAFAMVGRFMAAAPQFDVLYTDLALTDLTRLLAMAKRRDRLVSSGNYLLQDLAQVSYAGASAYVVRGSAKRRLLTLLEGFASLDRPYDMALADMVRTGQLRAVLAFPFLTSVTSEADHSSIQPQTVAFRDSVLNAFRRLLVVDRDLESVRADVGRIAQARPHETASHVGALIAAMVSEHFPDG